MNRLNWNKLFKVKKVKRKVFTIETPPVFGNTFDWNNYKKIIYSSTEK